MKKKGMNMECVKWRNRSSILNLICQTGPISRKDIAGELGLTPSAVTQISAEFIEKGILLETGILEEENRSGRKKVLLDMDYEYGYVFGINIEPERTTVALTNLKGTAFEVMKIATDKEMDSEVFLKRIAEECHKMRERVGISSDKIAGAGVGVTGLVDKEAGISVHAYGIWKDEVAVTSILEQELKVPVVLENNVTAFALAELFYGIGREKDNLLFVKWGPGVGSAIVADKKIYEGRNGKAAELGHFIIDKNGKQCSCGRKGCLETRLSLSAMKEQLREIFSKEETPKLFERLDGTIENLTREVFTQIAGTEEEAVKRLLDELLDIFARVIVNTMSILAPNRVILCGTLFGSEDIRKRITEFCSSYEPKYNDTKIIWTALADKEDYIGPVALFVRNNIIDEESK